MKEFVEKNKKSVIIVGFLLLLTLVISIVTNSRISAMQARSDLNYEKIEQFKQNILNGNSSESSQAKEFVYEMTDINLDRVDSDMEMFKEFIHSMLTWSSYDEYEKLRQIAQDKYGIAPKSQFLDKYMPYVRVYKSRDGSKYNKIDTNKLNSSFDGATTYVLGSSKKGNREVYDYVAEVKATSTSRFGNSSSFKTLILYSVDENRNIYSISAYVIM